jgi:glycosyltransferase involved in cell wall biosynthesis
MTDRTIIFDQSIDGHHLEYVHHLFCKASEKPELLYYFVLHPDFDSKKSFLTWPTSPNIKIDYFTQEEIRSFKTNTFTASYNLTIALKKRVKKFKATDVFLVNIIPFLPFIVFIGSKVNVSGIIYLIYLYRWKKSTLWIKIQDAVKFYLLSNFSIFSKIFLLNDIVAPKFLNRQYKTTVFNYLPDPFNEKPEKPATDIRDELGIDENKIVFLHFGLLCGRKGTMEILKAINSNKLINSDNFVFIFAGSVQPEEKEEFYKLLDKNCKLKTLVFDKYCEYEFLMSLCISCDYILIPYKNNEQSSGVLNYASYYNKPVIAGKDGLLGKIIKRYKLGLLMDNVDEKSIVNTINNINQKQIISDAAFLKNRKIENFTDLII